MSSKNNDLFFHDGVSLYRNKKYMEALLMFSRNLLISQNNCDSYLMRGLCYMEMYQHLLALNDFDYVIMYDKNDGNIICAKLHKFKCFINLGRFMEANEISKDIYKLNKDSDVLNIINTLLEKQKTIHECFTNRQYNKALITIEKCCKISENSKYFKIQQVECLIYLEKYQDAFQIINELIFTYGFNIDLIKIRLQLFWYQGDVVSVLNDLKHLLQENADTDEIFRIHEKYNLHVRLLEKGDLFFEKEDFNNAISCYKHVIDLDFHNVKIVKKLSYKIALCYGFLEKFMLGIEFCDELLEIDENCLEALVLQAKYFIEIEFFYHAKIKYSQILKLLNCDKYEQLLDFCNQKLHESNFSSPYTVLNVCIDAQINEIRKSYFKLARLYHPDKHIQSNKYVHEENERRMKQINEAYKKLSQLN